jgi:hypothetical protein
VRRLHLALYDLMILAASFLQGGLEELTFGRRRKKFSLGFIAGFHGSRNCSWSDTKKDLQAIRASATVSLGLSGITLPIFPCCCPRQAAQARHPAWRHHEPCAPATV